MFKKFDDKESVSSVNNAKNSVQKTVRNSIIEQYPTSEAFIDQILPKKETLSLIKCHDHVELFANQHGEILFFRQRDSPLFPSLRLLHKFPFLLPHMQVDRGAIRFLINGSNIMCPGLTSPGARMTDLAEGSVVAITAEGKQHAIAVGVTKMSTADILQKNKGIGIETLHYLNDGLWRMKTVK